MYKKGHKKQTNKLFIFSEFMYVCEIITCPYQIYTISSSATSFWKKTVA
jgi:hypothetical protein